MSKENQIDRGSSIRWHNETRSQLGYAVNMILGFSIASLGFQITLLLNKEFLPFGWAKFAYSMSLAIISISAILGIICIINRLCDFRLTTSIARKREEGTTDEELEPSRNKSENLGNGTWLLFWWQCGTFGIGIALMVISAVVTMSDRLL